MPSADRRQKQRIAKARAIAQASARESEAAASATATDKTASAVGSPLRRSNKSCQTIMSAQVVQSLIEAYWADLDRRHADQVTEPMQFIVSSYSAMSTSAPSRNQREAEAYYYEACASFLDEYGYDGYESYGEEEEQEEKDEEPKKLDKEPGAAQPGVNSVDNETVSEPAVCKLWDMD